MFFSKTFSVLSARQPATTTFDLVNNSLSVDEFCYSFCNSFVNSICNLFCNSFCNSISLDFTGRLFRFLRPCRLPSGLECFRTFLQTFFARISFNLIQLDSTGNRPPKGFKRLLPELILRAYSKSIKGSVSLEMSTGSIN